MTTTTNIRRALTVLVAALASLITWGLVTQVAGVDLVLRTGAGTERVTVAPVVVATLAAALVGWAVLAVLERLTRYAAALWATGAGLLLLASLQPALAPSDTALAVRVGLAALHAVVALVVVVGLLGARRTAPQPHAGHHHLEGEAHDTHHPDLARPYRDGLLPRRSSDRGRRARPAARLLRR